MADWQAMAFSFVLFILSRRPGRRFVTGHIELNDFGGGAGLPGWAAGQLGRHMFSPVCHVRHGT